MDCTIVDEDSEPIALLVVLVRTLSLQCQCSGYISKWIPDVMFSQCCIEPIYWSVLFNTNSYL